MSAISIACYSSLLFTLSCLPGTMLQFINITEGHLEDPTLYKGQRCTQTETFSSDAVVCVKRCRLGLYVNDSVKRLQQRSPQTTVSNL